MESALLIKEAIELGLEVAAEIPPGLGGAIDFVKAARARSVYGMFTSAAEFFADFIPGGKLVHLLERLPKLAKKIERLRKIFEELARIWGVTLPEARAIKATFVHKVHSAIPMHCHGLKLPPGFGTDKWVTASHGLTGHSGKMLVRQLDEGIAVEAVNPIGAIQLNTLNKLAREMASMLASREDELAKLKLKLEKKGITVHLHVDAKGHVHVVYSAPGVSDCSFIINYGIDGMKNIATSDFRKWTTLATSRMCI